MFADFPSALIPAWILGAPLVLAIVERMRTPRPRSSRVLAVQRGR